MRELVRKFYKAHVRGEEDDLKLFVIALVLLLLSLVLLACDTVSVINGTTDCDRYMPFVLGTVLGVIGLLVLYVLRRHPIGHL